MVEGKKDEGATRRVMGAWTLGAACARHLADLATAKRNIVRDGLVLIGLNGREAVARPSMLEIVRHRSCGGSKKLGSQRAFIIGCAKDQR